MPDYDSIRISINGGILTAYEPPVGPHANTVITNVVVDDNLRGPRGLLGAPGPMGPVGATGDTGPAGAQTVRTLDPIVLDRVFADSGAAIQGGLNPGDLYVTDVGAIMVVLPPVS